MDANPEEYFNFGFDRTTFQTYMMLMVLRRSQRENLYKNIETVHAQLKKSILNKEFLDSEERKHNFNPQFRKRDDLN